MGLGLFLFFVQVQLTFSQEQYQNEKFVIVLDVQQYWTTTALSGKESREMMKSINDLISRSNPGKVIYIKTSAVARTLSISFKGVKVDTVYADALDSNLLVVNNIIFEKTEGDAFATLELTDYLAENNAKEIIITGLLAERCVMKTVSGGISRGYHMYVIPEAIGSKSGKSKQKAIKEFQCLGCSIISGNK